MRGRDMWIHREARRREDPRAWLRHLAKTALVLEHQSADVRRLLALDALVACGEIEAALADAGAEVSTIAAATDELAAVTLGHRRHGRGAAAVLDRVEVPEHLDLETPEGFAFHGAHPESYACAMESLDVAMPVLVIGIRPIGTTLSAVVISALRAWGLSATRVTVRPDGPRHDRRLALGPRERDAILRAHHVVIVDAGPGFSGSTFLATAEAVIREGVPATRIRLVCSHAPDPAKLTAPNAAARWSAFRTIAAPEGVRAPDAVRDMSSGAWRRAHYEDEATWPASFTSNERRKLLSATGALLKNEGLGRSGREALARARSLAGAGLAPSPRPLGDGWISYGWAGAPLAASDVSARPALVDHLAIYCARRRELCPPAAPPTDLAPMVSRNLDVAFGRRVRVLPSFDVVYPATVDGRMMPHEWLRAPDGSILKVDGVSHGDDHLFPGPTDIAWDLAGVIVEWSLDAALVDRFLSTYAHASGDDPRPRIDAWVLAYSSFRLGWSAFARDVTADPREASRLARDVERYAAVSRRIPLRGG